MSHRASIIRRHFPSSALLAGALALALAGEMSSAPLEQAKRTTVSKLKLAVEIKKEGELRRITVYMTNPTADEISFPTGSAGGAGSLDDRQLPRVEGPASSTAPARVVGIPGIALSPAPIPRHTGTPRSAAPPSVTFKEDSVSCTATGPVITGPPRRSMQPDILKIPPGARIEYASFLVPAQHVVGKPAMITITLPDGGQIVSHGDDLLVGAEDK
jgi:hypothetical protein